MTHTTGPWRPQTSPNHAGLWETIDKRNGYLGQSFYKYDNAVAWCAEQNERALAEAAPELLAALAWFADNLPSVIRQCCPLGVPMVVADAHDRAVAAIAKATGEA